MKSTLEAPIEGTPGVCHTPGDLGKALRTLENKKSPGALSHTRALNPKLGFNIFVFSVASAPDTAAQRASLLLGHTLPFYILLLLKPGCHHSYLRYSFKRAAWDEKTMIGVAAQAFYIMTILSLLNAGACSELAGILPASILCQSYPSGDLGKDLNSGFLPQVPTWVFPGHI